MDTARQNFKVQRVIAGISIVLFLVKITAWYMTNSIAILTDALESIVNVVAGLVGLYSLHISAKPRDIDHPYGHGKAEFLSAAVEGTCIGLAGVFIVYEAGRNLFLVHEVKKLDFGILLVGATAIVNYVAGMVCVRIGKKNNSLALVSSGKHLQTDTYTTGGIIIGLILLYFTKISWVDSAVAILFALFIIYTGIRIIRSSVAGIMDEADDELLKNLVTTLNKQRRINWVDLHNVRIIKYGAILHLDCHLTVPWYFNVHEAHHEIDELSALVKKDYGESVELFVHSDGCLEFSCPICHKGDCPVRKHPYQRTVEWTVENIRINNKHHLKTGINNE